MAQVSRPSLLPELKLVPCLLCLLSSAVAAQEPAAQPVLEEMVVSASRTGDTLSETPISVTITPEIALRETDITDLEALSDRLPNAQLAITPTNTFLFVRGLGTGSVRSAEQSVGFFVDGVYLGRPQVALFDFLDVSQVELLRGPQGAILGKNTVAGALNVQTARPSERTEGYLEAQSGSDGRRRVRGALSGALTDTVSGRVAVSDIEEDGFLYNTTQDRTDMGRPGRGARAKLRWTPSDIHSYGISVQRAEITQNGDSFELSKAGEDLLEVYRDFDPQTDTDIEDNRTHTDNANSGADIEGQDIIVDAEWDLPFGLIRLLASNSEQDVIADFDVDISPVPFLTFPSDEHYTQRSAEFRFDKDFSWGDISAGLYYFSSDLDLLVDIKAFQQGIDALAPILLANSTTTAPGGGAGAASGAGTALAGAAGADGGSGTSRHRLLQEQETKSVFASLRWNFLERWTLRLDGRFTQETKDADQSIVFMGQTGPLIGGALGEEEYRLIADRRESDFSPRVSILTDISPTLSSYITVAKGFKSGGFNNLAAVPERAEFEEENSLTYEAGLRLLTDANISAELGIFRSEFKNLQVAALDGTEFFVGNAARATTQGIELSGRWQIGWGFALSGAFGYLDAEYDKYEGAPARAGSGENSQDLSGETLQRAPKYSGTLQLEYRTIVPRLGTPLAVGVVAEGASEQFLSVDLDPIDSQPGFVRYSAFIGILHPDERWGLRVVGRNLSDTTVRREAGDIALVDAHFVGVYPPKSLSVELGYRF